MLPVGTSLYCEQSQIIVKLRIVGRLEHDPFAIMVGSRIVVDLLDRLRIAFSIRLELRAFILPEDNHEPDTVLLRIKRAERLSATAILVFQIPDFAAVIPRSIHLI